ncbi:efflux ABC transporter, permease protein [Candidatus Nitrosopumilus salaria BD31]|uniref:Cell division protein FtsX n=1 Tax=Candidatus Nitrosopumilus salarius BD31 TaxID=859350 RepID=I3D0Z6_9ARCH|nr:permease-like cell division protein FtsX [Candidatus Nitrosopumilus salaria]EIJ65389.1 efflux ABC transporter, permease protein [Candidatus Nitrosopumilus salaria BD31]
MSTWLIQQTQALRLVLSRFRHNLLSTVFISLAIAVSLALPVIVYLVLDSFSGVTTTLKSESNINIFLEPNIDHTVRDSIHNILASHTTIESFIFVPKEKALEQLAQTTANQNILAGLDHNPLPDAFFIQLSTLDSQSISALTEQLRTMDGVAEVQIDNAWLKRLNYLLTIGKKAMFVLVILLGFAVFAVIGNTIRMQILTQQEEIEVSQLIGATKSFIRRPFLYAGAAYGMIGGLFALLISSGVILLFNQSISALASEYQTQFSLHLPDFNVFLTTCLTAMIIGLLSAYLAVSKSLFKSIN